MRLTKEIQQPDSLGKIAGVTNNGWWVIINRTNKDKARSVGVLTGMKTINEERTPMILRTSGCLGWEVYPR